jgi:hypothetical protein
MPPSHLADRGELPWCSRLEGRRGKSSGTVAAQGPHQLDRAKESSSNRFPRSRSSFLFSRARTRSATRRGPAVRTRQSGPPPRRAWPSSGASPAPLDAPVPPRGRRFGTGRFAIGTDPEFMTPRREMGVVDRFRARSESEVVELARIEGTCRDRREAERRRHLPDDPSGMVDDPHLRRLRRNGVKQ